MAGLEKNERSCYSVPAMVPLSQLPPVAATLLFRHLTPFSQMLSAARMAALGFLLAALLRGSAAFAQDTRPAREFPVEIPIARCDGLPVIQLRIGTVEMRFLLDTAASSFLNLKSFSSGESKQVHVRAWNGPSTTDAREISLPEVVLGNRRLRDLKLPAIDLSRLEQSCGCRLDGILGVELLDKLGVTINLQRQVAVLEALPGAPTPTLSADLQTKSAEIAAAMHRCRTELIAGDKGFFKECLDPGVVLSASRGEFRGRKKVTGYLVQRYLKFAPMVRYEINLQEFLYSGDAVRYSFTYMIDSEGGHLTGIGTVICRRSGGRWRIVYIQDSTIGAVPRN